MNPQPNTNTQKKQTHLRQGFVLTTMNNCVFKVLSMVVLKVGVCKLGPYKWIQKARMSNFCPLQLGVKTKKHKQTPYPHKIL